MKKPVNVSLNHKTINLLTSLAAKYHVPKTRIIEDAIKMFADNKSKEESDILRFGGSLEKEEGLCILDTIQKDRRNKNIEIGK